MRVIIIVLMLFGGRGLQAGDVLLGQSAALSGPASGLGTNLKRGIDAYFAGISGIKIESMDDKYEPKICEENTKTLLGKNVSAVFGYVGTPTAKVAIPHVMTAKKVFFGAFTGAPFIVDTVANPYSFNVRASYNDETEAMIANLTKKQIKKIAILIQNDAFGEVCKTGVEIALKKRNMQILAEGRFERNTIAVKDGSDKVIAANPEAIIIIGPYAPVATAIKYFKTKGISVPIFSVSFVGAKSLADQLKGGNTKNVYVTQVVPNPWDISIPIVKEYQEKVKSDFEFLSLEGYIMAKVMHLAIQKASDPNSSEILKKAIEGINTDLGGLKVKFGVSRHQGLDQVYLSKINEDGSFAYISQID